MGYLRVQIITNGTPCDVKDLTAEGLHEAAHQARRLADECEEREAELADEEAAGDNLNAAEKAHCPSCGHPVPLCTCEPVTDPQEA